MRAAWSKWIGGVLAGALWAGQGAAAVSQSELIAAGMPASLAPFAAAVSASEGTWTSVNQFGCAGAFQFCPDTLRRYFAGTRAEFLATPSAQVTAYRNYMANEWRIATGNGYPSLIGQTVCYGGQCATITESSILKGCQFGCGSRGALGRYHRTGDCNLGRDGNGVSVCTYLIRGAGLDVTAVTGGTPPPGPVAAGGVGMCFQRPLMSEAGLAVSSPFGVDRTGRASAGYHLGLDLVNSAGRGDPIYAGVTGRVVHSVANRSNSVFIETSDGRQRVGFLHGAARRVSVGDDILPDTPVITLGDAGSPGAVHLHLEVHVSGEVMAALGAAAGRVWPLADRNSFFGSKMSSGLSGASLAGAAPAAFYVVNPETYLWRRIPFRPNVLTAPQYVQQGLSRPDGLTLVPNCAPSADMVARGGMASTNGGHSMLGGVSSSGVAAMANTQTLASLASSGGRDAAIQYGQAAIGSARMEANNRDAARSRISVLAGLILTGDGQ